MRYFLAFAVVLFAGEFHSALGARNCPTYLGPHPRFVNIGENSPYYVRIVTPPSGLPIVTAHESNGNQVYDDLSFEAFAASRPQGRYLSFLGLDLGEGLTLEGLIHLKRDRTRVLIKKSFKIPSDSSEVKILYSLTQGQGPGEVGSYSEITSLDYVLEGPWVQSQHRIFPFISKKTFVRLVFEKGSPLLADIDVEWSMKSDLSNDSYVDNSRFTFTVDGTLGRAEWNASESREAWNRLFVSNADYCAPWNPCAKLFFRNVFNRELGDFIELSPDLVQEIARSVERREPLDILKLLRFAPQREPL